MMRSRGISRTALRVSFVILLSSTSALSQDQAPAPVFNDGDVWRFKITNKSYASSSAALNGIFELIYSQNQIAVFELADGQKTELSPYRDRELLLALFGLSKVRADLKFPLSVGQKWNYEYKFQAAGISAAQNRSVEVSVAGIEPVNTPAGSFRAFKLSREASWARPGGRSRGGSKAIYYFSAETKSIVKSSEEQDDLLRTIELTKFGAAPK